MFLKNKANTDRKHRRGAYRRTICIQLPWVADREQDTCIRTDGEVLYNLTKYKYDKAGNRIQERRFCEYQTKDSEGGVVHTIDYAYDADDRLIRVSDCTGAV